jgi:hypothetical protein
LPNEASLGELRRFFGLYRFVPPHDRTLGLSSFRTDFIPRRSEIETVGALAPCCVWAVLYNAHSPSAQSHTARQALEVRMGSRRRGTGRRKVGRKKRRMRSKIRHRK